MQTKRIEALIGRACLGIPSCVPRWKRNATQEASGTRDTVIFKLSLPNIVLYRQSIVESEEVQKRWQKLLEQGAIRQSTSPCGSPILLVPNKSRSWNVHWLQIYKKDHSQEAVPFAPDRWLARSAAACKVLNQAFFSILILSSLDQGRIQLPSIQSKVHMSG